VINASARIPEEENINEEEAIAYQKLVRLLDLAPETVAKIQSEVGTSPDNLIDSLTRQLEQFLR
jgi:hypothetical protein